MACPVKPDTLGIATSKGMIVPTQVPTEDAQGDICRQSTITIDLNHPDATGRAMGYVGGLYQKHPFGSDARYESMRRRSYAESSYSNIKNEAEQNLRRPNIRVMGRTKITLWALWVIMAANIRMKNIWQHRQLLAEQKCGLHHRPVISPAMAEAAKARRRAEGRRLSNLDRRDGMGPNGGDNCHAAGGKDSPTHALRA